VAGAEALCREALKVCREHGYHGCQAWSLHILGQIAETRGDGVSGRALYEQSLGLRRRSGATSGIAESLGSLARLARARGDGHAAHTLYVENLALRRALGDRHGEATALVGLADAIACSGDIEAAMPALREGILLARDLADTALVAQSLEVAACVAWARRHGPEAARLLGGAEALRRAASLPSSADADALHAALLAAPGPEDVTAAWEAGCCLTQEETIACALLLCMH
jgi:hypothetical protein